MYAVVVFFAAVVAIRMVSELIDSEMTLLLRRRKARNKELARQEAIRLLNEKNASRRSRRLEEKAASE